MAPRGYETGAGAHRKDPAGVNPAPGHPNKSVASSVAGWGRTPATDVNSD